MNAVLLIIFDAFITALPFADLATAESTATALRDSLNGSVPFDRLYTIVRDDLNRTEAHFLLTNVRGVKVIALP